MPGSTAAMPYATSRTCGLNVFASANARLATIIGHALQNLTEWIFVGAGAERPTGKMSPIVISEWSIMRCVSGLRGVTMAGKERRSRRYFSGDARQKSRPNGDEPADAPALKTKRPVRVRRRANMSSSVGRYWR